VGQKSEPHTVSQQIELKYVLTTFVLSDMSVIDEVSYKGIIFRLLLNILLVKYSLCCHTWRQAETLINT